MQQDNYHNYENLDATKEIATQEEMEKLRQKYNISTHIDDPLKRPVNKGGRANTFKKKNGRN